MTLFWVTIPATDSGFFYLAGGLVAAFLPVSQGRSFYPVPLQELAEVKAY